MKINLKYTITIINNNNIIKKERRKENLGVIWVWKELVSLVFHTPCQDQVYIDILALLFFFSWYRSFLSVKIKLNYTFVLGLF